MRNRLLLVTLLCVALGPAAAYGQDEKTPNRKPEKGDIVIAVGCYRGGSLESQETRLADDSGKIDAAITYRLTGDKELLKQLKSGHSKHLEEITGVLKSRLDPNAGLGRQIGKSGVYVGFGAPNASRAQPLPVLEITGFKHVGTECGR